MQKGAALYLGDDTDRPEMRFTCEISSSLYSQNSANFKIGVLVAPQSYFDEVNTNSYTVIDWITAFNTEGKQYLTTYDVYESSRSSTGYLTQFIMTDIDYENINRKFVAVGFVKITNGGTVTYKYSSFPVGLTYRTNARSATPAANAPRLALFVPRPRRRSDLSLLQLNPWKRRAKVSVANAIVLASAWLPLERPMWYATIVAAPIRPP